MENKTIKWFKVKCSFYQQEFGIKHWEDIIAFMNKHRCFDMEIKAQYTEPFEGVDGYYEDNRFFRI